MRPRQVIEFGFSEFKKSDFVNLTDHKGLQFLLNRAFSVLLM